MHSCDSLFLTSLPLSKHKPYISGQAHKFQSFTPDILSVIEFCSFLFRNVSLLVFLFLEQLPQFMPKCMQFPSLNIMTMCVQYLVVPSCLTLCDPLDYSSPSLSWCDMDSASLSMGFSRQKYWSGLPFSSPTGSYRPRDQT